MLELAHGHAVDGEREVYIGVRAFEVVGDHVVYVDRCPMERDRNLDGNTYEVRRVVPCLVVDLARVELGGLDCADAALLGGGAEVP